MCEESNVQNGAPASRWQLCVHRHCAPATLPHVDRRCCKRLSAQEYVQQSALAIMPILGHRAKAVLDSKKQGKNNSNALTRADGSQSAPIVEELHRSVNGTTLQHSLPSQILFLAVKTAPPIVPNNQS